MKLPLLFLLIFSVHTLKAQLYIAPSAKADSYIYAKERAIYVHGHLQLIENNKKESAASLYLRNGAQLLQGPRSNNQNKGSGKISVFQKGTSNAFDYNYWSLPVLANIQDGQINDYIFEPLSNTNSRNAKLISALDGQTDPLSISSRWIYTLSGSNYSNWAYLGDHFDLIPGEGFTMKGVNGINSVHIEGEPVNKGNAQTYDFRGLPNDGQIELPIKKDQVLLVGNPYPSSLDLNKFLLENTNTTGIAYFWDSRENGNSHFLSDYQGGYGTYSPGAGIYVPPVFKNYSDGSETGETGKYYDRKIIPIAQGFMIIGQKDGNLTFKNSQRVLQIGYQQQAVFKAPESTIGLLNLNIEIDDAYIQTLALVFREDSTVNEDHAMDARKMDENSQDISWDIMSNAFVINVRPKLNQDLIPLRISLEEDSKLQFSVSGLINFNPDRIFIYDEKDQLYFSIKTGYLKLELPKGEYHDRFYLSFIDKLPEVAENKENDMNIEVLKPTNVLLNTIDIFQNNMQQQLEIKMLYDAEIKSVKIFDLNGKLSYTHNFKAKEKEFYYPTVNLSNALYIVKVLTSDNKEVTKKIGIRN